MKINCVYFDDEKSLCQEIKQTKEQLLARNIVFDNMLYGFVIRRKTKSDLPRVWDDILDGLETKDIIWNEFGYDGAWISIGISYNKEIKE